MKAAAAMLAAILMSGIFTGAARAEEQINLNAIQRIESSGNPRAFNKRSGARGLFQITPIVLQDYNERAHWGEEIQLEDLFDPEINRMVATWYVKVRIPQMLRYYKEEVSVRNILVSYNAGIRYVVEGKDLPEETSAYLQKYEAEIAQ